MLFFIDESGPDQRIAPYEVLAAIAIEEKSLWNLITAVHAAEVRYFGLGLKEIEKELKGRKLLKRKVFRHAASEGPLAESERLIFCREFLLKGHRESEGQDREPRSRREYAAYGQAVLAFIEAVYDICASFRVKLFASMVPKSAPRPDEGDFLRKDYAILFERIFYFLEDHSVDE